MFAIREYNCFDIVNIDKNGILFMDETFVDFEECRYEWAKEHNISISETVCVASRVYEGELCYFVFYSNEKIKLLFNVSGFFRRRKGEKKFQELQVLLNRYGYTSYDMT